MSASALSQNRSPSACSNLSDLQAMAEESAKKRARVEVRSFSDIDLTQLSLKDCGKAKNGGRNFFPLLANEPIRFNLATGEWNAAPWGFDVTCKYEKPSFLSGVAPEWPGSSESLSLSVQLQPEQVDFLMKLDNAAKKSFADVAKADWHPVLKDDFWKVKVKVVLCGEALTKLTVVHNGKVERGEGWEFLKNFKETPTSGAVLRRSEVKLSIRVKKLWNMAGKAGLTLEASQLVLRPGEMPSKEEYIEEDIFADDAALLA